MFKGADFIEIFIVNRIARIIVSDIDAGLTDVLTAGGVDLETVNFCVSHVVKMKYQYITVIIDKQPLI